MMTAERGRRNGGRPRDALPQPRAVAREVRELTTRLDVFRAIYSIEHEALASIATPEVSVQSMPELTTVEATVADRDNKAARERCREAVKLLRRAATNVEEALRAFGPLAEQPTEPSRYAVVDERTFSMALHRKREEDLRRM